MTFEKGEYDTLRLREYKSYWKSKYRISLCNEKRTRIFVKSLDLAFLGGVLIH